MKKNINFVFLVGYVFIFIGFVNRKVLKNFAMS